MRKWILPIASVLIIGIGLSVAVYTHAHQRQIAFIKASTALAKSINILNHESTVDETGFASDPTKEVIAVAFAVKKVPVTEKELNSIMDVYLYSARDFDSKSDSSFIQPYQLNISVYKYALSSDNHFLLFSGTKLPGSNRIVWNKTT